MPCYHPIPAWRPIDDGPLFFSGRGQITPDLYVACGQCIGCRLERSRQWAVRIMHEAQMHPANSFVTLTYDDDHLPSRGSLAYPDVQKFLKRLRKHLNFPIRYFLCGEYGAVSGRPHYHICLFGHDFRDGSDSFYNSMSPGAKLRISKVLSRLWPFGNALIGDLTFESAAYTARYIVDKITGDLAVDHYSRIDPDTGEIYQLEPEFTRMSLKPGIGQSWYDKYSDDVWRIRGVVSRGHIARPPRSYIKALKRDDPLLYDDIATEWLQQVNDFNSRPQPTPAAAEEVAKARANLFSRNLGE